MPDTTHMALDDQVVTIMFVLAACVALLFTLMAVGAMIAAWAKKKQEQQQQPDPNGPDGVNWWSAMVTRTEIPAPPVMPALPAPTATPTLPRSVKVHVVTEPATHCKSCVFEMADEMGIPLDVAFAHVVGEPRFCHKHRNSKLARAREKEWA